MKMNPRRIITTAALALMLPAAAFAQSAVPEPDVNELQKQLQEMRAQMANLQNRIDEMEKAKVTANAIPDTQVAQNQNAPVAQPVALAAKPAAPKSPTTFTSGDWT